MEPVPILLDTAVSALMKHVARLEELLQKHSTTGKNAALADALKEARAAFTTAQRGYEEHICRYDRAMLELHKRRAINVNVPNATPLRTNTWAQGDLRKVRAPLPKRKKRSATTNASTTAALHGGIAAASSTLANAPVDDDVEEEDEDNVGEDDAAAADAVAAGKPSGGKPSGGKSSGGKPVVKRRKTVNPTAVAPMASSATKQ